MKFLRIYRENGFIHFLDIEIIMSTGKLKKNKIVALIAFIASTICFQGQSLSQKLDAYNVVWERPSEDASGQMPFGNGDIAAGAYAIEDGDLYLLLSKNDAFTYSGDIFKTGRVRVSLTPNPFEKGKPFRQEMDMKTGSVRIEAGDVNIRLWADANRPVYHIEINSPKEIEVMAFPEFWKRFDSCGFNNFDVTDKSKQETYKANPTQDVRVDKNEQIIWYYAVGERSVFKSDMKYYEVGDMIGKFPDPYNNNTFGNLMKSPQLALENGILSGKDKVFDIRIYSFTKQTHDISDWMTDIEELASNPVDTEADWANHCQWWVDFWDRSWIFVSDNSLAPEERGGLIGEGYVAKRKEKDAAALVTQSYNVFRYLMACQSRGKIQSKFNGGLFTQPLRCNDKNKWKKVVIPQPDGTLLSHEDDRDWGRRFTFQNQRLLYWPMIMSGDYDLMKPFFNYYFNLLPVRKAITKAWFGHEGAYYRENIEPTGAERDCGRDGKPLKVEPGKNKGQGYYHSFYFTSGLEIVAMMIDYVKYSGDNEFRDNLLLPFAREVLLFFDKHYKRDENGWIRLDPAMVLETWWIAVNPAPDIAGLQFCLDELLKMDIGTDKDEEWWKRFRAEIPAVHLYEIDGRKAIAPALEWKMKKNAENGELYPVFPFGLFGVAHGTEDIVAWTMKYRTNKNSFDYKCWTQDQIHWAYAGNAKEVQEGLVHRFRHASEQCRFPVYGSQKPDSCPDFDHFGAGGTALQRMLMQCSGKKIILLPAWPSDWDVDFKLHAPYKTIVEASVKNGKIERLEVTPESRKQDIIIKKSD
ncbi:MAG: DUF5703 domain-containing protein [Cytophagales bacterium]|nr:DUF5703 domain-containing protein [Cytophagales bacterium]